MATEGTLEGYRQIYMNEGLKAMIDVLISTMKQGKRPPTPARLNRFINAILYGANTNGTIRHQPPQPNPNEITTDYDKYKFEKKVYGCWVKEQLRKEECLEA